MTSIGEYRSRNPTQTLIWVYYPSPYNTGTPLTIYIVRSDHNIQTTHVPFFLGLGAWDRRDADIQIVQAPSDSFSYILRYVTRH